MTTVSWLSLVLIAVGGAIGATLRFAVQSSLGVDAIPLGTLTVNVSGSFLLAVLTAMSVDAGTAALLGTGLCGAFTTFSSFAVETVRLWEEGDPTRAVGYAAGTLILASGAVGAGWLLGRSLV
ncbi:MAG: fluoride efflux transporter CrcB [Halobacteriaceae archaeon]